MDHFIRCINFSSLARRSREHRATARARLRARIAVVCCLAGCAGLCTPATAWATATAPAPPAGPVRGEDAAKGDTYRTAPGTTLEVGRGGVLRNDRPRLTAVVSRTAPAHGTLRMQPDGSFTYRPEQGFTGADQFTYTATDAVRLYRTELDPLATFDGVRVTAGAYGSSIARVPGQPGLLYGLTDRGPNVDHPNGTKVEPLPDFTPRIGRFRLVDGRAVLERQIPLRDRDGTTFTGRLSCTAGTGETITDLRGTVLPCSNTGYDPEGLVAAPDGTFWVSDEYGPFLLHLDRTGRLIERLSPFDGSLPGELSRRAPNQGMEGLTLTPDGTTLVGAMQSALKQPDLAGATSAVPIVRLVALDLRSRTVREYLYLLDDPRRSINGISEITALSSTEFLVVERCRTAPVVPTPGSPGPFQQVFRVSLNDATDVGPGTLERASGLRLAPGARYDAGGGGLLVGERSLEAWTGATDPGTASALLADVGITSVTKTPVLNLRGLVETLDPAGTFFAHDKIEGITTPDGGRTLVIANDSDFGILGSTDTTQPFRLAPKVMADGRQDDGEVLAIRTDRLPARTWTATVTIAVR